MAGLLLDKSFRPGLMNEVFDTIGPLRDVEVVATGNSLRSRGRLVREYGSGRWRKMKGVALIRYIGGKI